MFPTIFQVYINGQKRITMDKASLTEWKTLQTVKDVQHLDLPISTDTSSETSAPLPASLTSLLRKGPKKLLWIPVAEEVFAKLTTAFTTAYILKHLGPSKSFIVEVDASETGSPSGLLLFRLL